MDDVTKDNTLLALWNTSYLAGGNAPYLEQLYESYLDDPTAVDPHWRDYFDSLLQEDTAVKDVSHTNIRNLFRKLSRRGAHPLHREVGTERLGELGHRRRR